MSPRFEHLAESDGAGRPGPALGRLLGFDARQHPGELVALEYDGLPVSDEFSLIEGAARGLAVIWDLAAAINVGFVAVIMMLELWQAWDSGEHDGS